MEKDEKKWRTCLDCGCEIPAEGDPMCVHCRKMFDRMMPSNGIVWLR